MTRILALETAGEACSVAILDNGQLLEHFELAERRQTERVLPMVEALLAEAQLTLSQLDAIAFGQGPGAFTGVRVAAAVTQGLAFAADLPVLGVSTLAACALTASEAHGNAPWVLSVFDARMGELYFGAYQCADGAVQAVQADCLCRPDALPALPEQKWYLAGSGLVYAEQLQAAYPVAGVDPGAQPRAAAVARLGLAQWLRGERLSAEQAQPIYLRNQVIQGAVR